MTANLGSDPFVVGRTLNSGDAMNLLNAMVQIDKELPGGRAGDELTIAGGTIIPDRCYHTVDTQGDAATDNLDNATPTNMPAGRMLLLKAIDGDRTVVVRHAQGGSGQFILADDASFSLDQSDKFLLLLNTGDSWTEVARCFGNDAAAHRAFLGLGTAAVAAIGTGASQVPTNSLLPFTKSFESAELAFNARTYTAVSHGLGGIPTLGQLIVRCKTAEWTWLVGDEAVPMSSSLDANPAGFDLGWGASSIWFKTADVSQPLVLGRKNDADGQARLTNANWRVVLRAWR